MNRINDIGILKHWFPFREVDCECCHQIEMSGKVGYARPPILCSSESAVIKNAFNSILWKEILKELKRVKVASIPHLRVNDYLSVSVAVTPPSPLIKPSANGR